MEPTSTDDDVQTLKRLGYQQELARSMNRFSNFAISFSIICILAGGITSFQLAYCAVGGAALGLGWPLVCLFSLAVAVAMGQIASAFPTAGGLYHWASILGGRGWGWATAWFNLAGLVTVLAAINMGTMTLVIGAIAPAIGYDATQADPAAAKAVLAVGVIGITLSQALFNHLGIKLTSKMTDFSGTLIVLVSAVLVVSLIAYAPSFEVARLVSFENYSGAAGGDVWPETANMGWLFALGLLHAGYTITGFDASAHTSEETHNASSSVPRGMVFAVLISGIAGWVMVCAFVLAIPDSAAAAKQGGNIIFYIMNTVLPPGLALGLFVGIALANYLCGLATVTSASRMMFAFARDGGLPWSGALRKVSERRKVPAAAIWTVALLAIAFTIYTPVYVTITIVCVIFLYISYVLPIFLGIFAYKRTWTRMGPFDVGRWYRPLALLCVAWCCVLLAVGIQPPYDLAIRIVVGMLAVMALVWFAVERKRFQGPPVLGS